MVSLYQRIKELEAFKEEFLSGAYPQRSMLGPGAISSQFLRSKSITSSMLDVSELSAVASNTGALTVTGTLTAGSGANTMAYDPTNGLYLGAAAVGSAPFKVTPAGAMTATGATVTGTVTANTLTANSAGSIAGWTIDSAKLSQGNTGIGNSGVYRFWSGNLGSPALSNFSVDSSGNLLAAGGTIAGMTVDSSKLAVGNAGVGSSGGFNFWSGNSTPSSAPFRVSTAGALTSTSATVTGAVTATSGSFTGSITTSNIDANGGTLAGLTVDGTLTIGSGGQISLNSGNTIIGQTQISIRTSAFGTALEFKDSSGTQRGSIYCYSSGVEYSGASGNAGFYITSSSVLAYHLAGSISVQGSTTAAMVAGTTASVTSGQHTIVQLGDAAGTYQLKINDSGGTQVFGINSDGELVRPIVNDSTALGAYFGRIPIYINGSLKYLAVYS